MSREFALWQFCYLAALLLLILAEQDRRFSAWWWGFTVMAILHGWVAGVDVYRRYLRKKPKKEAET